MGFDISIEITLHMCNQTGKAYYYDKDLKRIYELPSFTVPDELKQYLVGRGHIFHAYTHSFNEYDRYNVCVYDFLEQYPSWEEVSKSDYSDTEYWLEEDHNKFKKLLEWCIDQSTSFRVSWSY